MPEPPIPWKARNTILVFVSQRVDVFVRCLREKSSYNWIIVLDPPHAMEKTKKITLEVSRMVLTPQMSLSFAVIIKNAM
jgi:hypothetical protein